MSDRFDESQPILILLDMYTCNGNLVMVVMIHCHRSTNPVLLQEDNQQKKTLEEKIESSKHLINSFGQSKGIRYEYLQLIF